MLNEPEKTFVRDARVARLASVGLGEMPHNVPVCPLLDDGKLYVATAPGPKARNMRSNPQVSLAFDEYTESWSALKQVMVQGEAREVTDRKEWERRRAGLYEKFPQYEAEATIDDGTLIFEISISKVFASGL